MDIAVSNLAYQGLFTNRLMKLPMDIGIEVYSETGSDFIVLLLFCVITPCFPSLQVPAVRMVCTSQQKFRELDKPEWRSVHQ